MVENARITGFSTRIVKMVFDEMKTDIGNISTYPWKRAIVMLKKGKADALFSANYTQDRTAFAFYPEEPIVISPWIMWVRKENPLKFESFEDLIGKKVGVVRGYSYTPEFWSFIKKHKIYAEVVNDEMNFKKLSAGRVDFIVAELGNGLFISRTIKLDEKIIPLLNNPIKKAGLFIIFNKNSVDKSFVDKFSTELKKIKGGSFYKYLYYKNFGF